MIDDTPISKEVKDRYLDETVDLNGNPAKLYFAFHAKVMGHRLPLCWAPLESKAGEDQTYKEVEGFNQHLLSQLTPEQMRVIGLAIGDVGNALEIRNAPPPTMRQAHTALSCARHIFDQNTPVGAMCIGYVEHAAKVLGLGELGGQTC